MSDALASVTPQRLRTSRDILATMRTRTRCTGTLAVTHVRRATDPAAQGSAARVAVIASKKVGSAVARNRAKRLLRAAAREVAWAQGVDVVLVARASAATSTFAPVFDEVRAHAVQLDAVVSLVPGDQGASQ